MKERNASHTVLVHPFEMLLEDTQVKESIIFTFVKDIAINCLIVTSDSIYV